MKRYAAWIFPYLLLIAITGFCLTACKSRSGPPLSGEETVSFRDLTDSFPDLVTPIELADTALYKNGQDTILISQQVFGQFVPDSVMTKVFGKKSKPRIYPFGKIAKEKGEKYLFVKAFNGNDKALLVLCFDRLDSFRNAMVALKPDRISNTQQSMTFDHRQALSKIITRKNKDGSVSEGKNVYAYYPENNAFILIMTDPLDDQVPELVNPIDTMGRKQKFTADYVQDKRNIVSFRDGTRPGKLLFFIHFEKSKGSCTGEIKGEATMQGTNKAIYKRQGDPCGLEFTFRTNSVSLREITGCGNYRGIDCSFSGVYPRKKDTRNSNTGNKK